MCCHLPAASSPSRRRSPSRRDKCGTVPTPRRQVRLLARLTLWLLAHQQPIDPAGQIGPAGPIGRVMP
jgi:hypothetical protein